MGEVRGVALTDGQLQSDHRTVYLTEVGLSEQTDRPQVCEVSVRDRVQQVSQVQRGGFWGGVGESEGEEEGQGDNSDEDAKGQEDV